MEKINIVVTHTPVAEPCAKRKILVFQKMTREGGRPLSIAVDSRSVVAVTFSHQDGSLLLLTSDPAGRSGRIVLHGDFDRVVGMLKESGMEIAVFHKRTREGRTIPFAIPVGDIVSIDSNRETGAPIVKTIRKDVEIWLADDFAEAVRIWRAA